MDTKPVVDTLAAIPVGTIITWAIVICGIITAITSGISIVIKNYEKYRNVKEEDKRQREAIDRHDKALEEIKESLKQIQEDHQKDHEMQQRRLRHSITNACNSALKEGSIKLSDLRSIEELFDDYEGNKWVHTLVDRVKTIPLEIDFDENS